MLNLLLNPQIPSYVIIEIISLPNDVLAKDKCNTFYTLITLKIRGYFPSELFYFMIFDQFKITVVFWQRNINYECL